MFRIFDPFRYTGDRQGTISFNGCLEGANDQVRGDDGHCVLVAIFHDFFGRFFQCPNFRPANVLIGRTEYNIMMYDSRGSDGRR